MSQDMISKIKKLMALSHGEGNEAETAAKMAQKLMIKHAIEMADLEEHEKTVVDPLVVNRIKVGRRAWPIQLAWELGPHCRIKVLRTTRWDGVYAVGYGHQSDVQVWQYLYGIAAREIQKMAKAYGKEHTYFCWKRDKDVVDRKLTAAFRMGCVQGLGDKLKEQRTTEREANPNSTALILQDRMKESVDFMRSKVGKTGQWSGSTRGNSDGYRAGKTISLNQGIGGGKSQGRIGGD